MNQVLRINNDDPRITYDGEWGQNVKYSFTSSNSIIVGRNAFFLMFRGTLHTQWTHRFLLIHIISDLVSTLQVLLSNSTVIQAEEVDLCG